MRKRRLAVVDDDIDIAEFVAEVGKTTGFDIQVTNSVLEFQQICTTTPLDAIVMDIVMPDTDGIKLLGWLSDSGIKASIIIMSGYDGYIDMTRLLGEKQGLNIVGTLVKPFHIDDLEPMLNNIIKSKI